MDLNGANLGGTNFNAANLSNANLLHADLRFTQFHQAILSSSDFSNAILTGVILSGANLDGTNLSHAQLNGAVFANVDFSKAKGLETIQHRGPSTIGIDTIYKSKGQIPEIFLRGCGVPDIFIEYMHALTDKPFDFHHCYIGYSPEDEAFATRLHDTLQGKGVRCWTMEKNAKLGVPVTRSIEHGIRITDKLLVCCSKGISK